MPKITFTSHDGAVSVIDGAAGDSVMATAVRHGLTGITGECGGVLSCATCHVFVDEGTLERLDPPSELEDELLDGTAVDREPNSRLSCQITLDEDLGDIAVTLPEYQD